ncbi:MAG TPA: Ig-like domain-containing protein [Candidatus Binatia bacterium]|jgi:hypothetical protein|nr:Ig-like domain-containing protein [Candidatus Binatia bacterium]
MLYTRLRVLLVVVGLAFSFSNRGRASVTVTGASGGSTIPADSAAPGGSGNWTTLGNIQIAEGNKGDIQPGLGVTLVLKTPAGFEFNTNSSPATSFTTGGDILSASAAITDAHTLQITLTVLGTASKDTLTIGPGLQVRPTQTAPLAAGKHIYQPTTGGGTASISGLTTSADGSNGSNFGNLTEVAGAFVQLLLLMPGETAAPGTANGKTGSPSPRTAGTAFTATINAADQYWNLAKTGTDVVHLASSDARATLPPDSALVAGTAGLSVTFKTAGPQTTLTASDLTDGTKTASTSPSVTVNPGAASVLAMAVQPSAQATAGVPFSQQPVVLIQDAYGNIRSNDTLVVTASRSGGVGFLLGNTNIAAVNGVAAFTNVAAAAATNITLRFSSGALTAATSSTVSVVAGPFSRLLVVLPGETAAPGTTTGRAGLPAPQQTGNPFAISVESVDAYWNLLGTNDTVHLSSNDRLAILPADAALNNGSKNFTVYLRTAGTSLTVTASDVTHAGISPGVSSLLVVTNGPARGGPLVAIHDSELTRALETVAASPPTPSGPGTTGMQWWPTNWHYFFMPESLKEVLRSDGTAFQVVSDADIAGGRLLDTNGRPAYPIVISLAAEAIGDNQIASFTNYVAAGGFLFIGSSAFTRNPDGTTRGDFAFGREMGVHMLVPGVTNWRANSTLFKPIEHRLMSHIPTGVLLNWEMPAGAEQTPWGIYPHPSNPDPAALVWQVAASNATVLAAGDASPCLLDKQFGNGHFIYYAPMQPLLGTSGWSPGMYTYVIFRKAIEWAFDSAKLPVSRLSPWPYAYDAALVVRHDLEDYQPEINNIETFAQFEKALGAKGDYYFCTGTLRVEMPATYDTNAVIASLRRALTNDNATISSHNGGLRNPYNNPPLATNNYDFWHWGPDEALDTVPPGFPDGKTYALTSVSNSFVDIEGWFPGLMTNGMRVWVAPYFDATREASLDIQAQLGVKTTGEQKLSPFPHWTISTATSGKRYPMVTLPVSDWFVGSTVSQAMETGHTITTERALVDFYYSLGALINLYGHHLTTNDLHGDYVAYSMNTNLHPRLWPANAISLYNWWLQRSNAQMTVSSYATNLNQSVTTFSLTGAANTNTAIEFLFPSGALSGLQVFTNGVLAGSGAYRTNGQVLKLQVGTSVTTGQVKYNLGPAALNDFFTFNSGPVLTVPAPGVLTNDFAGLGGSNLTAVLVTGPTNGTFNLNSNGGFTYIPFPSFSGIDSFTYVTRDGVGTSAVATVTLSDSNPALFSDNFARGSDPGPLTPWVARAGTWTVTGGELVAGTNALATYANVFLTNSWLDYAAQAQLQFPVGAYGAGLGGRVDPASGTHYGAWLYPEGSAGGSNVLKLIKFTDWNNWTLLQQVSLAAVGTNWHTVKLAMFRNQIAVFLDGNQLFTVADNPLLTYPSGGVSLDMWTDTTGYQMAFDAVTVSPLVADDAYLVNENSVLNVGPPGLLANDTEVYGTNLTSVAVTAPANGSLTLNTSGGFNYTPAVNFFGTDAFIYQANDGPVNLGTAWARITVVSPLLNPPVVSSISVSNGMAVLTWNAVAGHTYRLQYEASLSNSSWIDLLPDTTATGPTITATNVLNGSTQRFYRVVLLP